MSDQTTEKETGRGKKVRMQLFQITQAMPRVKDNDEPQNETATADSTPATLPERLRAFFAGILRMINTRLRRLPRRG